MPEASFLEAHGRLDEGELESTMLSFLRGDADVLVATTIIESGLDVPAANTLIVERADNLGLAQAYQIRGRVGRSRERAYAYMLYPSEEGVTREAAARLATLADHTELGSGLPDRDARPRAARRRRPARRRAVRATSPRSDSSSTSRCSTRRSRSCGPAGGAERTDEEVRVDTDVSAFVPSSYVPYEAAKIDIHRRIAGARAPGELRALRDELRDRFGPPPEPIEALLAIQRARIEFGRDGARSLQLRGARIVAEPLELESDRVGRMRERIPEAIFSSREGSLTLRVARRRRARGRADRAARRAGRRGLGIAGGASARPPEDGLPAAAG